MAQSKNLRRLSKPAHFEIPGDFFLVQESSPGKFAWTLAAAFGVLSALLFWRSQSTWVPYLTLGASGYFAIMALFFKKSLGAIQKFWGQLGKAMEKVMNPLWMGLLFILVFTPLGIVMRLYHRDFFNRRFKNPNLKSYWTERQTDFSDGLSQQF